MTSLARDPRAHALLLAATLTVMSNATISPALPGLEAMFADRPDAPLLTRLLVTAPSLAVALLAPFAGMAVDRFGARWQLLAGVLLYALAGTAGFWLGGLPEILASRLLLGVAVALVMTSQTALIGHYFAGETRARFMGYQLAATNFGGFVFVATAGWLAGLSAQLPFLIYGLAFLYLPVLAACLPEPDRRHAGPSGGTPAEGPKAWRGALAGVALLAGLTFVIFYILPTQLPYYLVAAGHPDPATAGQVIAVMTLFGGVSALLFGRVRAALGVAGTPAAGYMAMAIGFFLLQTRPDLPVILAGAAALGVGVGLVMPNFANLALAAVPASFRGRAAGVITTAIFMGQFLSPLASQPLLAAAGYEVLFASAAFALVCLAGAVLVALRPRPAPAQP